MNTKPLGERVASLEEGFTNVCQDIKEIKDKLLGRPSWAVSVIITLLTTLCVGLMVYVVTL